MQIKIITFNVWDLPWFSARRHERIHRLGAYLKQWEPDIICLQEAFDVRHRSRIRENLGNGTYDIIAAYNKTRPIILFRRMDLTGGLVVLSKFPIRESVFHPFRRPLRMTLPERIGRKGFLRVKIETAAGPLEIVNTHLYSGKFKINSNIRLVQLKELLESLKKNDAGIPTVLAGDFNEDNLMNKMEFFRLIENDGFVDGEAALKKNHQPTYRFENPYSEIFFHKQHVSMRIDYIFLKNSKSPQWRFENYKVLPQPKDLVLSDHDPVLAILTAE